MAAERSHVPGAAPSMSVAGTIQTTTCWGSQAVRAISADTLSTKPARGPFTLEPQVLPRVFPNLWRTAWHPRGVAQSSLPETAMKTQNAGVRPRAAGSADQGAKACRDPQSPSWKQRGIDAIDHRIANGT